MGNEDIDDGTLHEVNAPFSAILSTFVSSSWFWRNNDYSTLWPGDLSCSHLNDELPGSRAAKDTDTILEVKSNSAASYKGVFEVCLGDVNLVKWNTKGRLFSKMEWLI